MLKNIRSSRKLEDACHSRIDVIWLMSGQTPDHSTIAAFITAHKNRVKDLFRRTVAAGISAGLIRLRHAAIDGTNIEANAGRGKVKSRGNTVYKKSNVKKAVVTLPEGAKIPLFEDL